VEDVEYLLVERYDRTHLQGPEGISLERLHQEDFCQALGIVSENKYQKEGGRRSSGASLCCARSPARRFSTWRGCWTQ